MSHGAMLRAFWVDRRWFDEHPDTAHYTRPYISGEFEEKFDPDCDDEDDRAISRAVAAAEEVEVWLSDAAGGGQVLRMRRIVGFEYPIFNDGWDAVNWMLQAGPPIDE